MKASLLLLLLVVGVSAQIKKPEPSAVKTPFAESLQAVVVTTNSPTATTGRALFFGRKNTKAEWKAADKEISVVVGRNGLAWAQDSAPESVSEFKREGDGKSPAGMFPLTYAFGRVDIENSKVTYLTLAEFSECVDDVNSNHYNKIVNRMQVGAFDWKSSEKMAEITPEYDLGVFVAYNTYPVVKGNGSCIFLHIWKDANTPTSGCTAMASGDLDRIVNWLDAKKNPYLIQLTTDDYAKYAKAWNLPTLK